MGDNGEEKEMKAPKVMARGAVPIQYPMLNNTNYGLWVVKMKIILRTLGVWEAVYGNALIEEDKDHGALAAISQAVPDPVMMELRRRIWQRKHGRLLRR
jgi:hypothetical protein